MIQCSFERADNALQPKKDLKSIGQTDFLIWPSNKSQKSHSRTNVKILLIFKYFLSHNSVNTEPIEMVDSSFESTHRVLQTLKRTPGYLHGFLSYGPKTHFQTNKTPVVNLLRFKFYYFV